MNTLPPYPGYDETQTLAAMLDGTNPISTDRVQEQIWKLAEIYKAELPATITPERPYKMTLDLFILIPAIAGACAIAGILAALGYDAISHLTSSPAHPALLSQVVAA